MTQQASPLYEMLVHFNTHCAVPLDNEALNDLIEFCRLTELDIGTPAKWDASTKQFVLSCVKEVADELNVKVSSTSGAASRVIVRETIRERLPAWHNLCQPQGIRPLDGPMCVALAAKVGLTLI